MPEYEPPELGRDYFVYDRSILYYFRACDLQEAEYLLQRAAKIIKRRKATNDANRPERPLIDGPDIGTVWLNPAAKRRRDEMRRAFREEQNRRRMTQMKQ